MKRWIGLACAALSGLAACSDPAPRAAGNWIGTLEVPQAGASLRLALHIEAAEDGALTGEMDSLDQGAWRIPLAGIESDGERLAFDVPMIGGRYEAEWRAGESVWAGEWRQVGEVWPLDFRRGTMLDNRPPPPPPPPDLPENWSVPDDAAIGDIIAARVASRPGAGMVVGVIAPEGRRIVARGPEGTDFGPDTVFEIGSITKVFTALLLAEMVVRGEVALDDPIQDYLPDGVRAPGRDGRAITLRHLAVHTSGLPRLPTNLDATDLVDPYADYDEAALLEFLDGHTLTRAPDAAYEYSNIGAGLLGYLLGRAAGSDYETLLRGRVLGPLGLDDTAIVLDADMQARFAPGHAIDLQPAGPWDLNVLAGAGALRSTAADLLDFLTQFIAGGGPLEDAMAMTMPVEEPHRDAPNRGALGWHVHTTPVGPLIAHDGGTGGYRAVIMFDPDRARGVAVLTNAAAEPAVNDIARHLLVGAPLAQIPSQPTQ